MTGPPCRTLRPHRWEMPADGELPLPLRLYNPKIDRCLWKFYERNL